MTETCDNYYSCGTDSGRGSLSDFALTIVTLSIQGRRNWKDAMQFIPVPNTVKVELIYSTPSGTCENVHYFEFPTAPSGAQITDLGAGVKTWWDTYIKPATSGLCSLKEIVLTDLTVANAMSIVYTTGLPIAGTDSGNLMPMNVTAALKKNTAYRGRSYRGRTYFIGMTEDDVTGDVISASWITTVLNAMNALLLVQVGGVGEWVVVSLYSNQAPRPSGVTTTILNFTCENTVDSQRRRLAGRGR